MLKIIFIFLFGMESLMAKATDETKLKMNLYL